MPFQVPTPVKVGADTDWVQIATGRDHTCGLKTNKTLWCWGNNLSGQLGIGNKDSKSVPTKLPDSNWKSVTAASGGTFDGHTCGLTTTGTLLCWGNNSYGQLGTGNKTDSTFPKQVGAASEWASVSAGEDYVCATKTNNTLWCWGSYLSPLGLANQQTDVTSPAQVGSDADWVSIGTGGFTTCATKADGTLWCWGSNGVGTVGDGTGMYTDVPVKVGPETDWLPLGGQGATDKDGHACALRANGTLWCWGAGQSGQLFDGTGFKAVPTFIY